ncbi:MAG: 30S ribosomal protein S16, partial [Actinobacteria bacterium]|nr:30S ribosomal protein S16 [Actinomycetota bacterium]
GHYYPREDPSVVDIDNERALYWLQNGAQASDSVRQLLRITGAWSEFSGEAPLKAPVVTQAAKVTKATPAASVTQAEDKGEEIEGASEEMPEEVATSAESDSVANENPEAVEGDTQAAGDEATS